MRRKNDTRRSMGVGDKPICPIHEPSNPNNGHVCFLHGCLYDTGLER